MFCLSKIRTLKKPPKLMALGDGSFGVGPLGLLGHEAELS